MFNLMVNLIKIYLTQKINLIYKRHVGEEVNLIYKNRHVIEEVC